MAFLNSLNIAGSGLTASRLRMDIISENIANYSTTKTEDGGPYRRKMVVYESVEDRSFDSILKDSISGNQTNAGVQVSAIVEDPSDFNYVYNPTHPDADEDGYVAMPNVDITEEMLDMMSVTRVYDMNINALNSIKSMAGKALEIGR
ncbi:MAG: flagellar basal body rod protein FlgC [Clostridia bacterium]|nr:flagellar basal body rod protein FlgC [Clostridia bacterium]